MTIELAPIGVIRSPYRVQGDAPRQGRLRDTTATIEIFEEYAPGLRDVEHCTHLFVLYWLDRADRTLLSATPPGAGESRGVFATRSPNRPNPIGLGIVNLLGMEGSTLTVQGLDALDGTPVLDLKPYVSSLDCISGAVTGSVPPSPGALDSRI
ncbi:MAG TPA: tRNA (N6-threonylcarbamoyladenosine(37)-N6)-methyltransferase TrmO [Methanoculleus sp.]|nr:tRNA (N6-threonylcarbamoyladenosine(37)-N6)-methyltransferase TrmO [Methanoculleus sp.]